MPVELCGFYVRITGLIVTVLLSVSSTLAGTSEECRAAYHRQDYAEALRLCRPLAEQGADVAQTTLGIMYERGLGGLARDDAEAAKSYRKAAEQGVVYAQHRLASSRQNDPRLDRRRATAGAGVEADEITAESQLPSLRFEAVASARLPRLRPECSCGVERVGGWDTTAVPDGAKTVKKLMLAGMLAVPLVASVAWADCLKDDPYYRCFDWYHAPSGEAHTAPSSSNTLAGPRKMGETMSTNPGFCAPLLSAILR
jgi:TPR repeat protein